MKRMYWLIILSFVVISCTFTAPAVPQTIIQNSGNDSTENTFTQNSSDVENQVNSNSDEITSTNDSETVLLGVTSNNIFYDFSQRKISQKNIYGFNFDYNQNYYIDRGLYIYANENPIDRLGQLEELKSRCHVDGSILLENDDWIVSCIHSDASDAQIEVWNLNSRQNVMTVDIAHSVDSFILSKYGNLLVASDWNGHDNLSHIWDMSTFEEVPLPDSFSSYDFIKPSPDNEYFTAKNFYGLSIWKFNKNGIVDVTQDFTVFGFEPDDAAFSADNNIVALYSLQNDNISIFNRKNGEKINTISGFAEYNEMILSPLGDQLLISAVNENISDRYSLILYDVKSGQIINCISMDNNEIPNLKIVKISNDLIKTMKWESY